MPPDQEDTLSVDEEETYYAQFDAEMNNGSVPLEMIGIPRFRDETAMYFNPTDADRQRLSELESGTEDAAGKNLLSKEEQKGFFRYSMEDKTVYVHPDFLERYDEILKEVKTIKERSMRTGPTAVWSTTRFKKKNFPDGTGLTYYRRRNGDLVRMIERPDGTVRKWVMGWTDLTPYERYSSSKWRDD